MDEADLKFKDAREKLNAIRRRRSSPTEPNEAREILEPLQDECHSDACRTLSVANLSPNATVEQLRVWFGEFGRILNISLNRPCHKSYSVASLEYDNISSVVAAIRETSLSTGHTLQLCFDKPKPSQCLWIGGLSDDMAADSARLRSLSDLRKCAVDASTGRALVWFSCVEAALKIAALIKKSAVSGKFNLQVDYASVCCIQSFLDSIGLQREPTDHIISTGANKGVSGARFTPITNKLEFEKKNFSAIEPLNVTIDVRPESGDVTNNPNVTETEIREVRRIRLAKTSEAACSSTSGKEFAKSSRESPVANRQKEDCRNLPSPECGKSKIGEYDSRYQANQRDSFGERRISSTVKSVPSSSLKFSGEFDSPLSLASQIPGTFSPNLSERGSNSPERCLLRSSKIISPKRLHDEGKMGSVKIGESNGEKKCSAANIRKDVEKLDEFAKLIDGEEEREKEGEEEGNESGISQLLRLQKRKADIICQLLRECSDDENDYDDDYDNKEIVENSTTTLVDDAERLRDNHALVTTTTSVNSVRHAAAISTLLEVARLKRKSFLENREKREICGLGENSDRNEVEFLPEFLPQKKSRKWQSEDDDRRKITAKDDVVSSEIFLPDLAVSLEDPAITRLSSLVEPVGNRRELCGWRRALRETEHLVESWGMSSSYRQTSS